MGGSLCYVAITCILIERRRKRAKSNNGGSTFDHALMKVSIQLGEVLLCGLLAGTDRAVKWQALQIQLDPMAEPELKVPPRAMDWHRCHCASGC